MVSQPPTQSSGEGRLTEREFGRALWRTTLALLLLLTAHTSLLSLLLLYWIDTGDQASGPMDRHPTVILIIGGIGISILLAITLALLHRRTVLRLTSTYQEALAAEHQARTDLARRGKAKDEFLATLSHELRTPMTSILGWARLLRDPVVRQQSLDRAIEAIDSNAKIQAKMIDDLLDMNRIISGTLRLKLERTDLKKAVKAAIESIISTAAEKRINIITRMSQVELLEVNGDPARLQQMIANLLSNAVKFTASGGDVSISVNKTARRVQIIIADTGEGISPELLPHLFDRSWQADGSRQHGGLGLGLAMVKGLAEMHGGTVSATSEGANRGATFTIDLPLNEPIVGGSTMTVDPASLKNIPV